MSEVTFRKTRNGEWVAFGPAALIIGACERGEEIVITKKNGSTVTRHVFSTGNTFNVDGVEMVYGYLEAAFSESMDWKQRAADLARRDAEAYA